MRAEFPDLHGPFLDWHRASARAERRHCALTQQGPPPRFVTRSRVGQAPAGARERQGPPPNAPLHGPSRRDGRTGCGGASFLCYECSPGQRDLPTPPLSAHYVAGSMSASELASLQPPPVPAHQAPTRAREGRHRDRSTRRSGARQRFVHRDGRPFTAQETELISSAIDEDMRAAAGQLAAVPQRLTELIAPYIRAVAEDTGDRRPPAEGP